MSKNRTLEKSPDVSRRNFLGAGAAATLGAVTLSASEIRAETFDLEYDIVVCGGGGAGLPTALFACWLGNKVLVLEKAATLGGTSFKAAYWYWVPNNAAMQKAGIPDSKEHYMKYVARLTQPQSFDPNHPRLGLTEWEYAMCEAIYDSAWVGTELLSEKGALPYRHVAPVPDYFAELETIGATGRVLFPKDGAASMSDGGQVATRTLSQACKRDGVDIKTSQRVQKVFSNEKGEVIGVEAQGATAKLIKVKAKKAVIFCTGGFTHDVELRKNFLSIPAYGGCAAMTNEELENLTVWANEIIGRSKFQ